jgi:DNA-binding transcriptional MerR regulator
MSSVQREHREERRSEERLSIGELARRVGASPSALRYWEQAGLLDDVHREGGRRRYGPQTVDRVGLIRLCQDAGFGIGEIRALLEVDPDGLSAWEDLGRQKLAEVEATIVRLQAAADLLRHSLACRYPSLGVCPSFAAYVRWRAEGGDPPELPDHRNGPAGPADAVNGGA